MDTQQEVEKFRNLILVYLPKCDLPDKILEASLSKLFDMANDFYVASSDRWRNVVDLMKHFRHIIEEEKITDIDGLIAHVSQGESKALESILKFCFNNPLQNRN